MKDKLNVCLLNDAFPPAIDGVANVVVNYAKVLSEMNSNVVVATPDYPGAVYDYNFEVLTYPSINTIEKIGYVTGVPFEINYLSKFVDKDIDILHTHCPMTSNYLARILRDTLHKPIVFTYHTKYDIDIQRAIKGKLIQDTAIKAIVENISACDEVWAVSKGAAENLKSLGYKGEVIIMENGIDMPKGKSCEEDILKIKQEYQIKNEIPTFLFVGRLMWYKGIKIILDALKMYKDDGYNFQMLFVGGGVEENEIKEYSASLDLNENVKFVGPLKDRDKLKIIFSACDLFLFPSTFDTNGLVVREAASSGLASVLIEGSCAAEGTEDNVNSLWIKEDAKSLFDCLKKIGKEDYERIGDKAMEDLYCSWEDAVKKAYERYELLSKKYVYEEGNSISDSMLNVLSELSISLNDSKNNFDEFVDFIENEKENIHELRDEIRKDIHKDFDNLKKEIKDILK